MCVCVFSCVTMRKVDDAYSLPRPGYVRRTLSVIGQSIICFFLIYRPSVTNAVGQLHFCCCVHYVLYKKPFKSVQHTAQYRQCGLVAQSLSAGSFFIPIEMVFCLFFFSTFKAQNTSHAMPCSFSTEASCFMCTQLY